MAGLEQAKGVRLLMAAWDRYLGSSRDPGLRLVIAGAGSLDREVALGHRPRPSVEMLGLIPPGQVRELTSRARAVLVPSVWEEPFGLVVVEAMAAGTPAIAAGHGSFPELVTPGVDGVLFQPGDPDALARAVADVAAHPEKYEGYGRRARETYEQRFNPDHSLKHLLETCGFATTHPVWEPGRPRSRRQTTSPEGGLPRCNGNYAPPGCLGKNDAVSLRYSHLRESCYLCPVPSSGGLSRERSSCPCAAVTGGTASSPSAPAHSSSGRRGRPPGPAGRGCGSTILDSPFSYDGAAGGYRSGTSGLPTYGGPGTDFPSATAGMVLAAGTHSYLSYQLSADTVYYLLPGVHISTFQADEGDAFVGGRSGRTATVLSGNDSGDHPRPSTRISPAGTSPASRSST